MCAYNLSKVALDSAAAGIEPAISSRKSNALTTAPPSHVITRQPLNGRPGLCMAASRRSGPVGASLACGLDCMNAVCDSSILEMIS